MGRASGATTAATAIHAAVACSPRPGVAVEVEVDLPDGATVLDAIRASGLLERFAEIDVSSQSVGIWGRIRSLDDAVAAGDRVEIYRALRVDPKEARRLRAKRAAAR